MLFQRADQSIGRYIRRPRRDDQRIVESLAGWQQTREGCVGLRLDQLLRDVMRDFDRLLNRAPLRHQPLNLVARRQLHSLGQPLDVQLNHVFHGSLRRYRPCVSRWQAMEFSV